RGPRHGAALHLRRRKNSRRHQRDHLYPARRLSGRRHADRQRESLHDTAGTMARSAIVNVMVQAATKAGRSLARDFGEVQNLQVSIKGPGTFVSPSDRRAEQIISDERARARSGFGFHMEERGVVDGTGTQHRWIVDPLDGTTNFLHGIPIFSISIALERQGQLVAGVIYNPAMDELYTAERG